MTDNFKVVKNKYKTMAVITAVALGVFCGVIVACALLLAFKLSEIELLWAYYLLIGAGVAACCTLPFYFLLRPNDKRLAAKLDKDYSLKQKVQTMVEFADREGAIVSLQREQTNEALAIAAKSLPDLKGLLKFVIIPVLAVAIACVSILIPAKKTTEVLPGFTLTATQRTAVNNLISDVNSSDLSAGLKVATTSALSDMLEKLENTTLQSQMKSTVINTVKGIDSIIAGTNSYLPLYNSLKNNEYTKPFASAMVHAVAYYKNTSATLIKSLDEVKKQSELSGEVAASMLKSWKDGVKDTFYLHDSDGNAVSVLPVQELAQRAEEYSVAFKEGLENCAFSVENDLLLNSVAAFADDIITVNPDYGPESYVAEIYVKCGNFVTPSAEDALFVQTYSCLMDEFIRNRTAEIFGLKTYEIGSNSNVVPDVIDDGDEGEGGASSGGGWGSGDINYGSNDLVLDPDTGEFVEYGTLLSRYSEKINERIAYFEALANKENATEEEKAEAKYVQGELSRYVQQYLDRLNGSAD
ncbi:MAG: hypothetical protein ACI4MC_02510 [Candidatus Coproplasma sp.]